MPLLATFRPRSATEILDATIQLYRGHAVTLLAIAASVILPPAVLAALVPPDLSTLVSQAGNILLPIGQGAIAVVIAGALHDETVTASDAYASLRGRVGSLIGVSVASGLLILIGFVLLVIPGIVAAVWTAVAQPVVAIEQTTGGEALGRSRALSRGQAWHIIGTALLTFLLVIIAYFGCAFGIGLLAGFAGLGDRAAKFLAAVLFILFYPVIAVSVTLLYFDLRVRNEGADLEAMEAALPPGAEPQRATGAD